MNSKHVLNRIFKFLSLFLQNPDQMPLLKENNSLRQYFLRHKNQACICIICHLFTQFDKSIFLRYIKHPYKVLTNKSCMAPPCWE